MTAKKNHYMRIVAIAAIFCVVCIVYVGRLFFIQITGNQSGKSDTTPRTVTISAVLLSP